MARFSFRSDFSSRNRPILRMEQGGTYFEVNEDLAIELRLKHQRPTAEEEMGYWYYDHPRNSMGVATLRGIYKALKHNIRVSFVDALGNSWESLLHEREVATLQQKYVDVFGSKDRPVQASENVDNIVKKLIANYHQELAGLSVLTVIEDYDPVEKAKDMGMSGSLINGYAKKCSGVFRELTGYDFRITVCKSIWDMFDMQDRKRLLDHELTHCYRTPKGRLILRQHDYQGFSSDLIRWPGAVAVRQKAKSLAELNKAYAIAKAAKEPVKAATVEAEVAAANKRKPKRRKRK